jgi:hypothetical protein
LALLVCEVITFGLIIIRPGGILEGALFGVCTLLAVEFVYRDARALNQAKGTKFVDATLWSLISLFLSFIALALYIFVARKGPGRRQYDVLVLGIFGVLALLGEVRLLVEPSIFPPVVVQTQGGATFSTQPFVYLSEAIAFIVGIGLIVIAAIIYKRRKTRSPTTSATEAQ